MSLRDYLGVLRERWPGLVVCLLLGLAAAAVYFAVTPKLYTATVALYVRSQGATTPQAAYQGAQLSSDRVKSYTGLVAGRQVAQGVIDRLHLDTTPEALMARIQATSALDSVVIDVSVTDPDPAAAARIANSAGDVFAGVVANIERPDTPGEPTPVSIRVVEPATAPAVPSSVGLGRLLVLGFAVGLVLGVVVALVRHTLDTSIRSTETVGTITGRPNLGTVTLTRKGAPRRLAAVDDALAHWAEAFRRIRTNLKFIDVDDPPRVLTITSSNPSEGKSNTVVNLATTMAAAGSRVLAIDADLRSPTIADLLGLEGSVGLTTVLTREILAGAAIQRWHPGGFDVLCSGVVPPNPSELLGSGQMEELLGEMRAQYDVVLVDTSPVLPVTDAAAVAPRTDGVILVCRHRVTSSVQLAATVEALEAVSARLVGTVVTMTPTKGPDTYGGYYGRPAAETVTTGDDAASPPTRPTPVARHER